MTLPPRQSGEDVGAASNTRAHDVPRLSFRYEGPDVRDGSIDAATFAAVLAALSQLVENAATVSTGVALRPRLLAPPERGSFFFELGAPKNLEELSAWATAIGFFIQWVGVPGAKFGLRRLTRWINEQNTVDAHFVLKSLFDATPADDPEARLLGQKNFVKNIQTVVQPLTTHGIDTLTIGRDGRGEAFITKRDALDLGVLQNRAVASATQLASLQPQELIRETFVTILRPAFNGNEKWSLAEPPIMFDALIEDRDFMRQVESGLLRFGKGDRLRVELRQIVWKGKKGGASFVILRVLEFLPATGHQ